MALRMSWESCIIRAMEKCFNIAGPCFPDEHYMLPALERLPGIMRIVEQRSYFVLHAARQSGKTTRDEVVDGMTIHFIGL